MSIRGTKCPASDFLSMTFSVEIYYGLCWQLYRGNEHPLLNRSETTSVQYQESML